MRQAAFLQRTLEVNYRIPHHRSLMAALDCVSEQGRASPLAIREMRQTVQRGNAAKHRRWTGPLTGHWHQKDRRHAEGHQGSELRKDAAVFWPARPPGEWRVLVGGGAAEAAAEAEGDAGGALRPEAPAFVPRAHPEAPTHDALRPGVAYPAKGHLAAATAAALRGATRRGAPPSASSPTRHQAETAPLPDTHATTIAQQPPIAAKSSCAGGDARAPAQ